jgi:hypothetical protein
MPNLLEATRQYWRKLDEVELAYQRGELSLPEVDTRVNELMTELGDERRAAFRFFVDGLKRSWQTQQEVWLGSVAVLMLTYVWIAN